MPKTRFRSITLCRHYPLAFILLTALLLTPALAQAFGLGKVSALFGIEPGSRLAKPYAVLKEQEFPYSQSFYPTSVAWSADGRYIADTGILTPLIHVWDVKTRRIVQTLSFNGQSDGYHAMAWSPDGRYLAVCANTGPVMTGIWDTRTWQLVAKLPTPHRRDMACQSPAFSPDSRYLAVATGKNVHVYATTTWTAVAHTPFRRLPHFGPAGYIFNIVQIAFRPHSDELAIGIEGYFPGDLAKADYGRARVLFWHFKGPALDLPHAPPRSVFRPYRLGSLDSLTYNPAGTEFATGTGSGSGLGKAYGGSARIWDATTHHLLGAPMDGHDFAGVNYGLAYTIDGRYLIVGHSGHSGEIDFIDARTFKVVDTVHADHLIGAIAVDPAAAMFVATARYRLYVWSIR